MKIQLRVNWLQERADVLDDNEGKHHGIYIFDCDESEFDEEAGYGSYDVLDVEWFRDECDRDLAFILNIYMGKDKFTQEENEMINQAIENEEILTEDIIVHFKEWVYSFILPINDEDIWAYDEHYDNGLTHNQNLRKLLYSLDN